MSLMTFHQLLLLFEDKGYIVLVLFRQAFVVLWVFLLRKIVVTVGDMTGSIIIALMVFVILVMVMIINSIAPFRGVGLLLMMKMGIIVITLDLCGRMPNRRSLDTLLVIVIAEIGHKKIFIG
jgi:hypothetical protein